jgi:hypothetical protein
MSFKITKDNVASVLKSMRGLTDKRVLVGIPSSTTDRRPDPDEPQSLTNAEIGYIMENGAPEANIPARPWLKPGVEDAEDAIAKRYEAGAKAVLDGRVADMDTIHGQVGLIAQNSVRKKITDGPFAPLAERTLAGRRARGRTGEKPLIDTGQLRNATTFVVRPTKG